MREPEWLRNLRWNAAEVTDRLWEAAGSPPIVEDPAEQEIRDYFFGYVQDARAIVVSTISLRTRLSMLLEEARQRDATSSEVEVLERAIAVADRTIHDQKNQVVRFAEKIEKFLELNGYQTRPMKVPDEGPTTNDD